MRVLAQLAMRRGGWRLLAALAACLWVAGCASTETENRSERPWNAPKSWEHGVPIDMMEGR